MTKNSKIQYVSLYTEGSAAREAEFVRPRRKCRTRLPKVRKQRQLCIRLDPLALCGIAVACVMLVLMIVGSVQLYSAHQMNRQVQQQVQQLENRQIELRKQYRSGYDLEQIRQAALAMGMTEPDGAVRNVLPNEHEDVQKEPTFWESVQIFFSELFA